MNAEKERFRPEDHFMQIKGKSYLAVKDRLLWWREEHPEGYVTTELVHADYQGGYYVTRAEVGWRTAEGQHIYATAHKSESVKDFAEALEKSETGAIGRCLALLGYGTAQALELDEGERIVDSPVERRAGQAPPQPTTSPATQQEVPALAALRAEVTRLLKADAEGAGKLPKGAAEMTPEELGKARTWLLARAKAHEKGKRAWVDPSVSVGVPAQPAANGHHGAQSSPVAPGATERPDVGAEVDMDPATRLASTIALAEKRVLDITTDAAKGRPSAGDYHTLRSCLEEFQVLVPLADERPAKDLKPAELLPAVRLRLAYFAEQFAAAETGAVP